MLALVTLADAFSPLARTSSRPTAMMRCRLPCLLDTGSEAERKQRLQQLFGDDFKDEAGKELARVSPVTQLNERKSIDSPPGGAPNDDELAGRRVRKQQTTSEMEQLFDIGARFDGLRTLISGVRKGSLGSEIVPGRVCIARRDFPSKYIVCDQAYEVRAIYYQGLRDSEVERIPVASMNAPPPDGCSGYVMYMQIFSEEYHSAPVIVRPEEVGFVSLGTEVVDSLKIAIPILGGWLTIISFLLAYGDATG